MNAFYRFRFYELDQSLTVGEERVFAFFVDPYLSLVEDMRIYDDMVMVFVNSIGRENTFRHRCRINSIYHPELGAVISIDTKGLDYTIILENEQKIVLNAEEEPGKVFDGAKQVSDWAFLVDLTPVAT